MKKSFILSAKIILLSSICLLGCENETPIEDSDTNISISENLRTVAGSNSTYDACGRIIQLNNTPVGKYTLAMSYGSSFRKFGIPEAGLLDFENIDIVNFEFSGKYADKAQTAKLYRIRRSDGKYLTLGFGVWYTPKYTSNEETLQLWLLNDLGNNKFNLIIPNYLGICRMARTFFHLGYYKIGLMDWNQSPSPGSNIIYVHTALSIPPNTDRTN